MKRNLLMTGLAAFLVIVLSEEVLAELGRDWVEVTASAPWAHRYYHTATAFGPKIILAGGQGGGDGWYTADGAKWVRIPGDVRWSSVGVTPRWCSTRKCGCSGATAPRK